MRGRFFQLLGEVFSGRSLRSLRKISGDYFRKIAPASHRPEPGTWRDDQITASWLGHATVLLDFLGVNILTDPVLGSRIGLRMGFFTLGPKRYIAPALRADELPRIDLVLLTHAHMDHTDLWTLRHLDKKAVVVTARGTADLPRSCHFKKIIELGWDETVEIETAAGALRVTAFRVNHWGARMHHDTHRSYNAYLLERDSRRVCVAGDTAFTKVFKRLRAQGAIDLITMPIAAYDPWIRAHCTPEQAIEMADMAGAKYIMPIHHETFKLSWEPMSEPIARFKAALAHELSRVALTSVGETFVVPDSADLPQIYARHS